MPNRQNDIAPPKFWMKLFRFFCRKDLLEELEGDLLELYEIELKYSKKAANRMLVGEVFRLLRPRLISKFKTQNTRIMLLSNYFKVALRNALRYKSYAFLNLFGLIVGVTSSIFIYMWVADEYAKDKFHENGNRLFAVKRNMQESVGVVVTGRNIPYPLTERLRSDYPEIEQVCEVSWPMENLIEKDELVLTETGRLVGENFFEVFSFPLIEGEPSSALGDPSGIVISDRLADKFLANQDDNYHSLLGITIMMAEEYPLKITGIFEYPGEQSSAHFDWVVSAAHFIATNEWVNSWENGSFEIFLLANDNASVAAINERIDMEIEDHTERVNGERLWIQKYEDQYLYGNYENGQVAGGRITYVRLMAVVGLMILIIAAINFMNLATARSSRRSKEIGLRKVMGAYKSMISGQFMFESFLYVCLAFVISISLVLLLMPYYNLLVNKELNYLFSTPALWVFTGLTLVLTSFLSGSYPSFRLSTISLLSSLRGEPLHISKAYFRKGLFAFQLITSFVMLFGAWVVYKQLNFMLESSNGIQRENVIAVELEGETQERYGAFREELLKVPGIKAVTAASGNPINYGRSTSSAKWEGQPPNTPYEINVLGVSDDFIQEMGMNVVNGVPFNQDHYGAKEIYFMLNETAVNVMGFEEPVGKKVSIWGTEGTVIGVVKDYHMSSFHSTIPPLIIFYTGNNRVSTALVKLDGTNLRNTLTAVEDIHKDFNPKFQVDYYFLDEAHKELYEGELTLSKLSLLFVIISVVIALLGLHGLSGYTAEKRTKEIGIRRVHGASVNELLILLTKEYTYLMLVSFLLAIPLGYWVIQNWLDQFAYRISIGVDMFLVPGVLLLLVGTITVGYKSFKSAQQSAVKSLRSE